MLALEETIFYPAMREHEESLIWLPQDGMLAYAIYRALAALLGATD